MFLKSFVIVFVQGTIVHGLAPLYMKIVNNCVC